MEKSTNKWEKKKCSEQLNAYKRFFNETLDACERDSFLSSSQAPFLSLFSRLERKNMQKNLISNKNIVLKSPLFIRLLFFSFC